MNDQQALAGAPGVTRADLKGGCPPALVFCPDRAEWGCFGMDVVAYGATQEAAQRTWRHATGSDKVARVLTP